MIDTNLVGPFLVAQAVARSMVRDKRRGSIINISSVSSMVPSSGETKEVWVSFQTTINYRSSVPVVSFSKFSFVCHPSFTLLLFIYLVVIFFISRVKIRMMTGGVRVETMP